MIYEDGKNEYQKALADLERQKCVLCNGLGYVCDAEPGDIFFNKAVCPECNGTGLR